MFFFFFKQKTAYEMRISDWSSDVCSSDLCRVRCHALLLVLARANRPSIGLPEIPPMGMLSGSPEQEAPMSTTSTYTVTGMTCGHCVAAVTEEVSKIAGVTNVDVELDSGRVTVESEGPVDRSEEHTSELPSLMRNSYAVFSC